MSRKMKLSLSNINRYLFFKLPSAWLSGVRVILIDEINCHTKVKYKWINTNPYNSMFWAVQGMAAELTTGMLLSEKIKTANLNISMLLISSSCKFFKKATNSITFKCSQGKEAKDIIDLTSKSENPYKIELNSIGYDDSGDIVSEFKFIWSCKKRINGK